VRKSHLIAAVVAAVAGLCPAADPWWSAAWSFRRAVTVPVEQAFTRLPGEDVAVVTIATAGKCQPDGSDIRVATDRGHLLASRVLMMGPGDFAKVAFAVRPSVTRYYVYFGCPDAKPADTLDIRRGILMETWEYDGGPTGSLEQMRRVVQAANRTFIGRGFVDRVFIGYNPFGPQSSIASVFTGWLKCPRDGTYTFVTSSQNASFLLMDDMLVVSNGGHHGPQHDIRVQGTTTLKAGLHKLTFYHASRAGDPIVVAAWRLPGETEVHVIPPGAYTPVADGQGGPLGVQNNAPCIDFTVSHDGEAFLQERYFHRYTFKAGSTGLPAAGIGWQWDFGDGQQADGAEVEHVYLRPGLVTVTLKARTGQGAMTRANRIFVTRRWETITTTTLDGLPRHARIVSDYDFGRSDPETLLWAMLLCHREGRPEAVLRAGEALAKRPQLPSYVVEQAIPMYADLLVSDRPAEAAGVLVKAASAVDNAAVAAALLVKAGGIHLRGGDDKAAEALFNQVIGKYGPMISGADVRAARIGLGDVWRRRGELEKAGQAYGAAGVGREFADKSAALARGDLARHVEAYIRQKEYDWAQDYLQKWQDAYPEDRLEGYVTLLWVRLLAARQDPVRAAEAAEELVGVNPASHYAAQLLLEGAEAWGRMARSEKRKALLEKLIKDYPESAAAGEARKLLQK